MSRHKTNKTPVSRTERWEPSTTRPPYDGAELRRNPGIPEERFKAFSLPSLINGKLVEPKRKA